MPLISVLMPSYNHGKFLPETLGSLLTQTVTDWELVAVDDCSSDQSREILKQYNDPRIRVFENETNLGTYGSLARALTLASGDLIAVLNSDDIWSPSKLEAQVKVLEKNPSISACYTAGTTFGDTTTQEDFHGNWPVTESQELLPYLLEQNRTLASSVIFRRHELRFDPSLRYSGDWDVLLRAARSAPLGFVPEKLTSWRIHDRNSFVRSEKQVAEEIRMRNSILANPDLWRVRSLPEASIQEGLSKCALHLSALLVLEGRMREARMAGRLALSLKTSVQTLKRFAVVHLSREAAIRQLWKQSDGFKPSDTEELISFA